MENEQITLREMYVELKNLERVLKKKGVISQIELSEDKEIVWNWPEKIEILADEDILKEDWLSQEDEEAWKDL